ncbi:cytosine permease [Streptomyces sp. NPDC004596]
MTTNPSPASPAALEGLVVVVTGPAMAVAVTDLVVRRNRYNGAELLRQEYGGPFWYHRGVHWPGVVALVTGGLASLTWVTTSFYTGPLARAAGGVDLAIVSGVAVSALVYWASVRVLRTVPRL